MHKANVQILIKAIFTMNLFNFILMQKPILILGACGQIGTELTYALRDKHGNDVIIASDIREGNEDLMKSGPFELLDATDYDTLEDIIAYYEIRGLSNGCNVKCNSGKISDACLELEYEFTIQRFKPSKGKKDRQDFLAFKYCCFWPEYS